MRISFYTVLIGNFCSVQPLISSLLKRSCHEKLAFKLLSIYTERQVYYSFSWCLYIVPCISEWKEIFNSNLKRKWWKCLKTFLYVRMQQQQQPTLEFISPWVLIGISSRKWIFLSEVGKRVSYFFVSSCFSIHKKKVSDIKV